MKLEITFEIITFILMSMIFGAFMIIPIACLLAGTGFGIFAGLALGIMIGIAWYDTVFSVMIEEIIDTVKEHVEENN